MNDKAKIDALRAALEECRSALACCYDVDGYPANGRSQQDDAIKTAEKALALTADASEQAPDRVEVAKHGHLQWRKEREGNAPAAPVAASLTEKIRSMEPIEFIDPAAPVATPVEFTPGAEGAFDTDTKLPRLPQWFLSMLEREGRARITIDHKGQHWNVVKAEAAPVADTGAAEQRYPFIETDGVVYLYKAEHAKLNPIVLDGPIGEFVARCPEADAYMAKHVKPTPASPPTADSAADGIAETDREHYLRLGSQDDRTDAMRYRWLRHRDVTFEGQDGPEFVSFIPELDHDGSKLDASIDAAIDAVMHHTTGKEGA